MHRIEGLNFTTDSEGHKIFTEGPPPTVVTDDWLTSVQEEISGVIEGAGISLYGANGDPKNQLLAATKSFVNAGFRVVISSQEHFNAIIERTGANAYRFITNYRSVYLRHFSGGYQMSGALSPLSGGDTWGELSMGNVDILFAETGGSLDFGNTEGYVLVDNDDCHIYGLGVIGTGTVASAISYSFYATGLRSKLVNCKTSSRLSNATFYGFTGGTTEAIRATQSFVNCTAYNLESSGIIGAFHYCYNINNCFITTLTSSAAAIYGFHFCNRISNCHADSIVKTTALTNCYGFNNCFEISNCYAYAFSTTVSGAIIGFESCSQVSSCRAYSFSSTTSTVLYGFENCDQISGCRVFDFDSIGGQVFGFRSCDQVSSCLAGNLDSGTANAHGFNGCKRLSSCYVDTLDTTSGTAYGYNNCDFVSACSTTSIDATTGDAYGFYDCDYVSACLADDIDSISGNVYGFNACTYVSSSHTAEVSNPGCSYVDTSAAAIDIQYSCSSWAT